MSEYLVPQAEKIMIHLKRNILLALVSAMVLLAWLQPLDEMAAEQAEDGLKRAVASFATARALNAVISVAQGTEFAVQPFGIGVNFAPGQALDPLNDLVEKFSDLMLMASVAFGAQVLLLKIGLHWAISLALTLAAGLWAWFHWREGTAPQRVSRLLVALLLVRFIMPLAGVANDAVYRVFMASEYTASQQGIEQSSSELAALTPDNKVSEMKWWEFSKQIDRFKATIDRTVDHTIRLIVVFLIQTLVLPLAMFWILLRSGRLLTR
jgi:hypothetical protein